MSPPERLRILIVDDEEAILETMAFTFENDYEVLTARDAREGLVLLDAKAPVAAVVTDQRMPEMSGVEFLARVCERHPDTTRIILTGFADLDTVVQAINEGHVYAYVPKPWEPDELKQLMRRAVDHHRLRRQNDQLMQDLKRTNAFLAAAMDEIPIGALAVDARGIIRAVNRPARKYLGLDHDPQGLALAQASGTLGRLRDLDAEPVPGSQRELEVQTTGCCLRLRVGVRSLLDGDGKPMGSVYLLREISHEPLLWRFEEVLHEVVHTDAGLRGRLERARKEFEELHEQTRGQPVDSPDMAQLAGRIAQALTAVENWLAVDAALAEDAVPDARMLVERMRLATARWPLPNAVPERVSRLARRVEAYYESGEKTAGEHTL